MALAKKRFTICSTKVKLKHKKKHKHFNNKAEKARREKNLLNLQANIFHNRNTKNRVESVYYIFEKSCQCHRQMQQKDREETFENQPSFDTSDRQKVT